MCRHTSLTLAALLSLPCLLGMGVARALEEPPNLQESLGLERLVGEADLILMGRIILTDYTATAADGPMYGEIRLGRVIKGPKDLVGTIRFGASAWMGPSYQPGELRIVFLKRVPSGSEYFKDASWSSLDPSQINLFFPKTAIYRRYTESALRLFLQRLARGQSTPPTVEFVAPKPQRR